VTIIITGEDVNIKALERLVDSYHIVQEGETIEVNGMTEREYNRAKRAEILINNI